MKEKGNKIAWQQMPMTAKRNGMAAMIVELLCVTDASQKGMYGYKKENG